MEDHVLHATQGLVTRAFTDELWNMALSKIIAVLRTHSVGTHMQKHTCGGWRLLRANGGTSYHSEADTHITHIPPP